MDKIESLVKEVRRREEIGKKIIDKILSAYKVMADDLNVGVANTGLLDQFASLIEQKRERICELLTPWRSSISQTVLNQIHEANVWYAVREEGADIPRYIAFSTTEQSYSQGGYGSVHLALDLRRVRIVAIKQGIDPHFFGEETQREIANEAVLAAQLSEISGLEIIDLVESPSLSRLGIPEKLMVMAFMDPETNPTLADTIYRGEGVGLTQKKDILRLLAKRIDLLHQASPEVFQYLESTNPGSAIAEGDPFHGDIKPGNMFVRYGSNGNAIDVAVCDFGISPHVHKRLHQPGTLFYTSPERMNQDALADQTSDVFSYGLIVYELFRRETIYEGDASLTASLLVDENSYERFIETKFRQFPNPQIAEVIKKMLAFNRDERYQTCTEAFSALQEKLNDIDSLRYN